MIVKAAIKYNDKVYTGKRHFSIIQDILKEYPDAYISQDIQGFVTDEGQFLRRAASLHHALKCGQIESVENLINSSVLTSEDLW